MNTKNENNAGPNAAEDIIVLGVASVDTQGPGGVGEGDGIPLLPGISEE